MSASEDIFASALDLEETHQEEGFQQGQRDGRVAGLQEGRELGVQKGSEIAQEVGFYAGCVAAWQRLRDLQLGLVPPRALAGVAAIERMLRDFPLTNPQDDRLQDAMEELRGRFKAVVAAMGLHEGYFPKDAGAGMAF